MASFHANLLKVLQSVMHCSIPQLGLGGRGRFGLGAVPHEQAKDSDVLVVY
jgi:hypothetical protein